MHSAVLHRHTFGYDHTLEYAVAFTMIFSQNFHFSIDRQCVKKKNILVRNVESGTYICIALSTVNHGTDD